VIGQRRPAPPHHQPAAGAGKLPKSSGLLLLAGEAPHAKPIDLHAKFPVRSTLATQAPAWTGGMRSPLPSSRPGNAGFADDSAQIRARCEIDLSPGTRALPLRGAGEARASRGVGWRNGSRLGPGAGKARRVTQGPGPVTGAEVHAPRYDSGVTTSQVSHRVSDIPGFARPHPIRNQRICPTTGKKFYDSEQRT